MRATFIGDPNDDFSGPKVFSLFDRDFPKDKPVSLAGFTALQVSKLKGNNHFEVEDGEAEGEGAAATDARTALLAKLDDLNVEHDKRWGMARLNAALAKAQRAKPKTAKKTAKPQPAGDVEAEFKAWAEGDD